MRIRDALLLLSIHEDSLKMMKVALFLGANPNYTEKDEYFPEETSALKDALRYGRKNGEQMALTLIEKGAHVNLPQIKENLLHTAVQHYDSPRLVEEMVKYGGDLIKGSGPLRTPPLTEALSVGHFKAMQKLLDLGSPIDVTDANGRTPLMECVRKGQHDVLEYLLTNGADIHKKDNFGETVAHYAVRSVGLKKDEKKNKLQLKTLRMIKEAGVDFFEPDKTGKTAYALARELKIDGNPFFRPFFNKMFQEASAEWTKNDAEQRQIRADYTKRKQKERD
ncbi:MAG: ankyrin repeat domain-containing protein [Alphaproteobacteria bacterium]|nr:ankyrin repeat domain-containing protein [Alphaproteobacteria bacterium]